jgi:hypothetical protein
MNVKIFTSYWSGGDLEQKINRFITYPNIKIIEIQYRPHAFGFTAMVIYNIIIRNMSTMYRLHFPLSCTLCL